MNLVCSYAVSGFEYFTKSKLMELRGWLPKPLKEMDDVLMAQAISSALMKKQTGGVV